MPRLEFLHINNGKGGIDVKQRKLLSAACVFISMSMLVSCSGQGGADSDANSEPDSETFERCVEISNDMLSFTDCSMIKRDYTYYYEGESILTETAYQFADYYVDYSSYGYDAYVSYDGEIYYYYDEDPAVFEELVVEDPGMYEQRIRDYYAQGFISIADNEILVETEVNDGMFIAVTEDEVPDEIQMVFDQVYIEDCIYEYEEGMKIQYIHTFDAETSLLTNIRCFIVRADGSSELFSNTDYSFDEQYDAFADGEPFAEYAAMREDPAMCRDITFVFAPDTDDETEVEYTLINGSYMYFEYNDGPVEGVYLDRECTIPYDYDANSSTDNLVLYIPG